MKASTLSQTALESLATVECALCRSKVNLTTIKQQTKNGWPWRDTKWGSMCGYCAHSIFEEHDPVPEGVASNTCRCGVVMHQPI